MAGIQRVLVGQQNDTEFSFTEEAILDYLDVLAPQGSQAFVFDSEERPSKITWYRPGTQSTSTRLAELTAVYDSEDLPTTVTWKFYDSTDGTVLLKTVTTTYTWAGDTPTQSTTTWT